MMRFKVTVAVELRSNFYGWMIASGGKIKILSPDDAITEFRDLIGQNKAEKRKIFSRCTFRCTPHFCPVASVFGGDIMES